MDERTATEHAATDEIRAPVDGLVTALPLALRKEYCLIRLDAPERLYGTPVVGRPVDVLLALRAPHADAQCIDPAIAKIDVGIEAIGVFIAIAVLDVFHRPFVEVVERICKSSG